MSEINGSDVMMETKQRYYIVLAHVFYATAVFPDSTNSTFYRQKLFLNVYGCYFLQPS